MFEEKFAAGDSYLHKLDPRCKIIICLISSFIVALGSNLQMLLTAFLAAILLIIIAKLPLKSLVKRLLVLNFFVLLVWLFIPFTYPGQVIANWGPLAIHQQGIFYALTITIRSNTIILLFISLIASTSMTDLIHAFYHFKLPDKLIYLFFFVYRYLFVIRIEFKNIYNSILLRGFTAKTSLHTYRTYAYLIGYLLIKSYDRSNKIYQAMLCRGYKGKIYLLDEFILGKREFVFTLVSVFWISYLIFLEKGFLS
ncbi:cobalt ECF transporter T component CbiQ [Halanaerobium salsuginis]|uniref:Cobalt/nickel transport system permease protein n=1 Tax=Halanaerobium salsuginis TaxID=29563 RepID=A0A1I4L933_9FIRM|nr:cobalt ECF transporter T component CbiQ [Halanaerobium salsuginis]SFL87303.1 cobalt/nickel transport system permease protein [Halanaerobium salsuginis]